MQLSSILQSEHCAAKTATRSKKGALELISQLAAAGNPDIKSEELFFNLISRERLGSTGIGQGIAVPHCRHDAIKDPTGICITLAEPIDFDSVDNEPVDILFAVLVPREAEESHLQALAAIAEKLQKPELLNNLRKADSAEKVCQLVTQ